jgi:hypothetical protein
MDPKTIKLEVWQGRAAQDVKLIPRAGEIVYRLKMQRRRMIRWFHHGSCRSCWTDPHSDVRTVDGVTDCGGDLLRRCFAAQVSEAKSRHTLYPCINRPAFLSPKSSIPRCRTPRHEWARQALCTSMNLRFRDGSGTFQEVEVASLISLLDVPHE